MISTTDFLDMAESALAITEHENWPAHTFLNKKALSSEGTAASLPEEHTIEWHPLIPFLPANTHILFLGSFPPQQKRWCMNFFYPNFTNDHWRIEGTVFFNDPKRFVDNENKTFRLQSIVEHLKKQGIGFFDTALAVRRLANNASDRFLQIVTPTDVKEIAKRLHELRAIVTTGEKATETLLATLGAASGPNKPAIPSVNTYTSTPLQGVELYRLPSSSRAYPLPLTQKAEAYKRMFERYLSTF